MMEAHNNSTPHSIDIEITDSTLISQLDAIQRAVSYTDATHVFGTSSELNPIFDVIAYKDINKIINNLENRVELLS